MQSLLQISLRIRNTDYLIEMFLKNSSGITEAVLKTVEERMYFVRSSAEKLIAYVEEKNRRFSRIPELPEWRFWDLAVDLMRAVSWMDMIAITSCLPANRRVAEVCGPKYKLSFPTALLNERGCPRSRRFCETLDPDSGIIPNSRTSGRANSPARGSHLWRR
jgi:hypothetical protein